MQPEEEEAETSESEEKEVVEPDPKPEPAKRKQPQVRPWDVGKEGVKEGRLLVLFFIPAFLAVLISFVTYDLSSVMCNDYLCCVFISLFLICSFCGMFSD